MEFPGLVFSIGCSHRKMIEFLSILLSYRINRVIDVRALPYSRYSSSYNQNVLPLELKSHGIEYLYMGDHLGGRITGDGLSIDGISDYDRLKNTEWFVEVINSVITMADAHTVLMCSELNPIECSRTLFIGRYLKEKGVLVSHIVERGKIKFITQEEIEFKLIEKYYPYSDQLRFDFLEDETELSRDERLRRAYRKQALAIAMKKS